jgi:PAS domain S-box-containing protein
MVAQLRQELAKLKYGDHICLIYENTAEQLAAVVAFTIEGLTRGDRCVHIIDDPTKIDEVAEALKAAGVDFSHEQQRGSLRFLHSKDTYLRAGEFVPQAMIHVIRQLETETLADGYSGMRLTAEPIWSFGPEPGCDRLIEYEALVNHLPTNSKSMILCQYHQSRFGVPCIHDILRTHPVAILGDQVCPNPYYELPEMVLRKDQEVMPSDAKAKRVDWWIAQLRRRGTAEQEREQVLEKLKQSERRLAEAQRVAHLGSWERDLRTNEVIWSDELYSLFGLQKNEIDLSYQQFLKLLVPEEVDRIRSLVDEAIRTRGPLNFDYRIIRADGSVRVMHEQGSVIVSAEGEPIRLVGTAQDVTDQRRMEEMLEENRRRYLAIFENALDSIVLIDDNARFVDGNPAACALLGYSREELVQLTVFDTTPAEDRPRVQDWLDRLLSEGTQSGEITALCKDGTTREIEYRSVANILPGLHLCAQRDITERNRAEEALRQSEDRIRLIIDTIPVMAWSVQPDGIVDFLNRRWTDYAGLSLEQYVEEPTRPIHPEDIPRIFERWRVQMAAGEGYEDELRLRRRDGEYRWFLVRTAPLRDEQGDIVKWYGVSTDIDARKRAEQAVRESQQLLHMVLITLPVGVAVTDRAGDIILANPAGERIWGKVIVSGDERRAQSKGFWHDSGKRIDPESWASGRALSKGETSLNELIDIESFDGQQKTIQNSVAPIRDAEGLIVGAVVVNEDVTERVRAQKALRESADRLQHLSRRLLKVQEEERRHLARELHDEFGQALATITLHLHAARSLAGVAALPRLDQCVTLLQQAGEQVRRLALELRPTMLDTLGLEATLRWLAEQYQQRNGSEVQIVGHLSGAPLLAELTIAGFRVVQEALTNVVRHASAQHVWIELSQSESVLEVVVHDDGVGFDVAATQELSSRRGSLGLLGMAERVQLLGGKLDVESEPGRGTRIRATFPLTAHPDDTPDPEE